VQSEEGTGLLRGEGLHKAWAEARSAVSSNRESFEDLVRSGRLHLQRSSLFDLAPGPMPPDLDSSRIEGMMLGLPIGDALGNTSEGILPEERSRQHGEIRDYLPNRYAGGRAVGLPSDDTQLAFWTLERILEDGGVDPERLAEHFAGNRTFGIGSAVREFVGRYSSGSPWFECGQPSAGNGALMRIAPVRIPHLKTGSADLWVDTALAASVTHNDPGSTAACVAFVSILWGLLTMSRPPEPGWWVERYVEVARGIEGDAEHASRSGAFADYRGSVWRFVAEMVPKAHAEGLSVRDACNRWYSGAYLLETVPCLLYILMQYADDPEAAMVRAVNDTLDNDTVGAIVGAAVGALHGKQSLPERWITGLLGRTSEADDGWVSELLARARDFVAAQG